MSDRDSAAILSDIWAMLERGATDRRSPAHHPVVATVGGDGRASQRVMILRAVDADRAMLGFQSDARSPKIGEITNQPDIHILVYDVEAKVQLRIAATAVIETGGATADAAWEKSTAFARRCYLATAAPGSISACGTSGLPAEVEGRQPSEASLAPARANFAVIIAHVNGIDWLHLANSGHRRMRFDRDAAGQWRSQWLVP